MSEPMLSLDEVRVIMTKWIKPFIDKWENDGDSWRFESFPGEFYWFWSCKSSNINTGVGAKLICQGSCIAIWSINDNNTNILVKEDKVVIDNEYSNFEHFNHDEMHDLYLALMYHDTGDEAEEIMNNNLDKESNPTGINIDSHLPGIIVKQKFDLNYFELYNAYAVYDQAGVCAHGILISANENVLTFCTYGIRGSGRTDLIIDIDEYTEGKFTIKPLIVGEQ